MNAINSIFNSFYSLTVMAHIGKTNKNNLNFSSRFFKLIPAGFNVVHLFIIESVSYIS